MWNARSAFGIAVYPNYQQIFIVGGSTDESNCTKHCERYIVNQNIWKRLPELKEPKFQASLCFFNNGGTLYCFGGLKKLGPSQFEACKSIERLSKGQNHWQLLSVQIPSERFDLGTFAYNQNQIILFGGFNEGPKNTVYTYRTGNSIEDHGSFEQSEQNSKLESDDFFPANGIFLKT